MDLQYYYKNALKEINKLRTKNKIQLDYDNDTYIPKIIWQTYKTLNLPLEWKNTPNEWKKHFPEYEYRLQTDLDNRNFIILHAPWFLYFYDNFNYNIMRVDAIRVFWMYFCGGIYSDLDIAPTSDFSFFFKNNNNEVYLVKTQNIESTTNCIFASKRYAPFWLNYMETMVNRFCEWHIWKLSHYFIIIFNTGPQAITYTVKKYNKPVCYMPDCLISTNLTNPKIRNEIYTTALKGQSWNRLDSKILLFFYINRNFWIFLIIIIHLYLYYNILFLK